MRVYEAILELLFPVHCIGCNKKGVIFCISCLSNCKTAERENLPWVYSVYDYREPLIKKAVWLLKYKNTRPLSRVMGSAVYDTMLPVMYDLYVLENFRESIIVPIPLSTKRLMERGYNQAELIAKEICRLDRQQNFKPAYALLHKVKETQHQARIHDRSSRLKNLVGTFSVADPKFIKNKNVILIDDVTTTGATLLEAKKVLKRAGAKKVIAFTFAH